MTSINKGQERTGIRFTGCAWSCYERALVLPAVESGRQPHRAGHAARPNYTTNSTRRLHPPSSVTPSFREHLLPPRADQELELLAHVDL